MEKLFYTLKELEEKVPYSRLSYIVQNPHYITEEEFEEWNSHFHDAIEKTKKSFEQTLKDFQEVHREMSELYGAQKEDHEEFINRSF